MLALIKCPECKRSISDTSIRCPFCDFVLIDKVVEEQKISAQKCQVHQKTSTNRVLEFLRFNWFFNFIDNIADDLSYIPLVGTVLSFALKLVCILVTIAILVGVVGVIIAGLFYISPFLAMEAMMVASTVVMYFETYKQGVRTYVFWFSLALTIIFPFIFVFV